MTLKSTYKLFLKCDNCVLYTNKHLCGINNIYVILNNLYKLPLILILMFHMYCLQKTGVNAILYYCIDMKIKCPYNSIAYRMK